MSQQQHQPYRRIPAYGSPAECHPISVPLAKEGQIQWGWCPGFTMIGWFLILCGVLTIVGFFLLFLVGIPSGRDGIIAYGVILLVLGCVGSCGLGNWLWNQNKQYAYSIARGKRIEALRLWKNVGPNEKFRAKDTFFETRYGGKTLRVLRDGTIESHGFHNDIDAEGGGDSAVEDGGVISDPGETAAQAIVEHDG